MVERKERGWPGHYICAADCLFRRNTLLRKGDVRIIVSMIGNYRRDGEIHTVGVDRYYETMAFHADFDEGYWEANVERPFDFDSPWQIRQISQMSDEKADEMHETVVCEISDKLK